MKVDLMNKEPDDNGVNMDFGFVKNEIIAKIPQSYLKREVDGEEIEITPQEVIDESYDALIQSGYMLLPCKFFNEFHGTTFSQEVVENFYKKTRLSDKIQQHNIFLSNELWNEVMSMKKTGWQNQGKDFSDYYQRLNNKDIPQVNFSSLEVGRFKGKYISILNTIQFNFEDIFDENVKIIEQETYDHFKKLFDEKANSNSVDAINDLAGLVQNFSLHKYFLPYGPSNVDEAYLLLRYDASSVMHKNGVMPPLYRKVYPEFVTEPHFHFTRGFGSFYKLTSKMNKEDFATGYAIGVTDLKKYIEKINHQDFVDEKEEKLYMENDFGMPFLRMYKKEPSTIDMIEMLLDLMVFCINTNEAKEQMVVAYDIMGACAGDKTFKHFLDDGIKFKNPYINRDRSDKDFSK